mmetsp:Transcript_109688/g.310297  ORF Transcript_109688/g.310297 Transcript_109688/m.310297 type:complete len:222 (-) Transcript_109688:634-1299(-)
MPRLRRRQRPASSQRTRAQYWTRRQSRKMRWSATASPVSARQIRDRRRRSGHAPFHLGAKASCAVAVGAARWNGPAEPGTPNSRVRFAAARTRAGVGIVPSMKRTSACSADCHRRRPRTLAVRASAALATSMIRHLGSREGALQPPRRPRLTCSARCSRSRSGSYRTAASTSGRRGKRGSRARPAGVVREGQLAVDGRRCRGGARERRPPHPLHRQPHCQP